MSLDIEKGLVGKLSEIIGTSEPALRLLLTILAGYPLALLHRKFFYAKDPNLQHLYFITSGFLLGYWNYGVEMLHPVVATLFTYMVLAILGGSSLSVAITFIFNLLYLLIGYIYFGTNDYDINWTMPQCILVLRLIAVAYDLYDGYQPQEKLSAENKKVALQKKPSILELFGHCLFPAAFLVGPQFSLKRYQHFVTNKFSREGTNEPPDSVNAAVQRFLLGVGYLGAFQILGMFVPDEYMISDEIAQTGFLRKMMLMGMWGRYTLYRYISCWLLTEGACILFGIAYNGEENNVSKFDGVENVKIAVFESTTEFNHYIQSFNTNTNHWVAQYIYKRLKFLGNRHISQLAALLFLAIWHGLHSGYYVCFAFEFTVIYMERDVKSIINSNEILNNFFSYPHLQLPKKILLRVYTFVFMGWCLIPFVFLKFEKYWRVFANFNYVGFIFFGLWPIIYGPLIRFFLKKVTKQRLE